MTFVPIIKIWHQRKLKDNIHLAVLIAKAWEVSRQRSFSFERYDEDNSDFMGKFTEAPEARTMFFDLIKLGKREFLGRSFDEIWTR